MNFNVLLFICKEADHGLHLNLEFEGQTLTSFTPGIIANNSVVFFVSLFTSLSLVSCEFVFGLFFSTQFRRNKVRDYVPDSDSDLDSDENEDPDLALRRVSQTYFPNFLSNLI